jgi:transcriptional regulator NrdR family protein
MIDCPKCSSPTRVVGTYNKKDGRRRTHHCKRCEHRFCTHQPHPQIVPFDPAYIGLLTEEEKRTIRFMRETLRCTYLEIAVDFHVSESTIRDVIKCIRPDTSARQRLIATHSH